LAAFFPGVLHQGLAGWRESAEELFKLLALDKTGEAELCRSPAPPMARRLAALKVIILARELKVLSCKWY
jgi:hypothetical protein